MDWDEEGVDIEPCPVDRIFVSLDSEGKGWQVDSFDIDSLSECFEICLIDVIGAKENSSHENILYFILIGFYVHSPLILLCDELEFDELRLSLIYHINK